MKRGHVPLLLCLRLPLLFHLARVRWALRRTTSKFCESAKIYPKFYNLITSTRLILFGLFLAFSYVATH